MTYIKSIYAVYMGTRFHQPGEVFACDDDLARRLVQVGTAEVVKAPVMETATRRVSPRKAVEITGKAD